MVSVSLFWGDDTVILMKLSREDHNTTERPFDYEMNVYILYLIYENHAPILAPKSSDIYENLEIIYIENFFPE